MKRQLVYLFFIALVFSGCTTYNYYAVSNKRVDMHKYHTYAWLPETQLKASSTYNNDIATDRIVESASAELNQRGFILDNKNPDLLIKYTAVVNSTIKTYRDPVYYNPPPFYGPRIAYYRGRGMYYYSYYRPMPVYVGTQIRRMAVKEGSIMIDIIDRNTKKVIWRGWAEGEVNNPEKAINDIPQVIANIFKRLS